MQNRIRKVLLAIGLPSVPDEANESLLDHGLDSLMIVLSVAAFEKEFSLKIPADKVDESAFATLENIEKLLKSLGAK
jgi:acyl carrier protein